MEAQQTSRDPFDSANDLMIEYRRDRDTPSLENVNNSNDKKYMSTDECITDELYMKVMLMMKVHILALPPTNHSIIDEFRSAGESSVIMSRYKEGAGQTAATRIGKQVTGDVRKPDGEQTLGSCSQKVFSGDIELVNGFLTFLTEGSEGSGYKTSSKKGIHYPASELVDLDPPLSVDHPRRPVPYKKERLEDISGERSPRSSGLINTIANIRSFPQTQQKGSEESLARTTIQILQRRSRSTSALRPSSGGSGLGENARSPGSGDQRSLPSATGVRTEGKRHQRTYSLADRHIPRINGEANGGECDLANQTENKEEKNVVPLQRDGTNEHRQETPRTNESPGEKLRKLLSGGFHPVSARADSPRSQGRNIASEWENIEPRTANPTLSLSYIALYRCVSAWHNAVLELFRQFENEFNALKALTHASTHHQEMMYKYIVKCIMRDCRRDFATEKFINLLIFAYTNSNNPEVLSSLVDKIVDDMDNVRIITLVLSNPQTSIERLYKTIARLLLTTATLGIVDRIGRVIVEQRPAASSGLSESTFSKDNERKPEVIVNMRRAAEEIGIEHVPFFDESTLREIMLFATECFQDHLRICKPSNILLKPSKKGTIRNKNAKTTYRNIAVCICVTMYVQALDTSRISENGNIAIKTLQNTMQSMKKMFRTWQNAETSLVNGMSTVAQQRSFRIPGVLLAILGEISAIEETIAS